MPPDGVQKRICQPPLVTGPRGPEIPGIFVIERLNREHNAPLGQVISDMRCISLAERAPSLTPLAGPVAQLIEGSADAGEYQILHVEYMPPIVAKFFPDAEILPLRRFRAFLCMGRR